jgi:hypothetical protein
MLVALTTNILVGKSSKELAHQKNERIFAKDTNRISRLDFAVVNVKCMKLQRSCLTSNKKIGSSPKEVSLLAVKEPGHMIECHHYN